MRKLIEKRLRGEQLNKAECIQMIEQSQEKAAYEELRTEAVKLQQKYYGNRIFVRGLIEFTNICKNNCYYCGIRCENANVNRYRLSKDEILACCEEGYHLGYRTFVLQGGEDPYFSDDRMVEIVEEIHKKYEDCAITLSIGERSKESYARLKKAGAARYLLRHETASELLYQSLHPADMSLAHRKECLFTLKELGYQVGAGMMIGSPGQTLEDLAEDLVFLQELNPHMIGMGPFIPHHDTKYALQEAGSVERTLQMLSIVRIMFPRVLLPATTALGTLDSKGREKGILAGANVLMPNLSPVNVRKDYALYDDKICTGEESAQCVDCLERRVASIGYEIVHDRGDSLV